MTTVPGAITAQQGVPYDVMLAELVGSHLESNWNAGAVGDQGTSVGPYQIHLPAHPGVSAAQASDPVWSTQYMTGAYEAAVNAIPPALWQTNPEQAAEQAAVLAERPAQSYYASQGQGAVDAAYAASVAALGGTAPGGTATYTSSPGGLTLVPSAGPFPGVSVSRSTLTRTVLMIVGILVLLVAFHALVHASPGEGPITVVTTGARSANANTGPPHTPVHQRVEHAAEHTSEAAAAAG